MKQTTLAIMTIAGLACASSVLEAEEGWYALVGAGQVTGNNNKSALDSGLTAAGGTGFSSTMNTPTVYKLEAGYQIIRNFAVEGGYLGSNNENYSASGGNLAGAVTTSANVKGWNLTAVGILPINEPFSLLGKLGVASTKLSATVAGPGGSVSVDGTKTDATYGIGAQYSFTKDGFARVNVDSFNVGSSSASNRDTVWTIDLGVKF